jgi:hypothetical protein
VSTLLEHVAFDFDRRMAARRGMMAHLGIAPTEAEAPELIREIRETLLTCGRCDAPGRCLEWQKTARAGMPPQCSAREAFARLNDACNALREAPRDAFRHCA